MTALRSNLNQVWRRVSWPDLFALAFAMAGGTMLVLGRSGGLYSFAKFLGLLAVIYAMFRLLGWWRTRLLWSLRNRLIVAYLFVALVPVLLVSVLAVQGAMILYTQLGGYLLYEDVQTRIALVADGAEQIASALRIQRGGMTREETEKVVSDQVHEVFDARLPGLRIAFSDDAALLNRVGGQDKKAFAGLLQEGTKLTLVGLRSLQTWRGTRVVQLSVPVTPELLGTMAPDLDAVYVDVVQPYAGGPRRGLTFRVGDAYYESAGSIRTRSRYPPGTESWFDPVVSGVSRLVAAQLQGDGKVVRSYPVVASFRARPSRLNARIFSSLGELGYLNYLGFFVIATVLFVLEVAALVTGVVMTRRITKAVDDLYNATQHVRGGDFAHQVKIERRDQLGVLGESFNLMTGSITNLINEQKQRQKLENEISIAREVQNQLFPQRLPAVPGVQVEAICTAARMVSGDYYDFIQLSPTSLAIVIADISGKGISAALLMASLQASLRSLILAGLNGCPSTAELVARLNKHLVRNTGDDRFATFFIAVYDRATRELRYTNAGHLPALCICDGTAVHLEKGGIVLGVVEDYSYEEGSLIVPPGALLVEYSDGLVEPENVYGEEFGISRLKDAALSLQHESPRAVAVGLMQAAEEWASTPEQADDMTVIVVRLS